MADPASSPRPPPPPGPRPVPQPGAGPSLTASSPVVPVSAPRFPGVQIRPSSSTPSAAQRYPTMSAPSPSQPSPFDSPMQSPFEAEDAPAAQSSPPPTPTIGSRPQMRQVHSVANVNYPRPPSATPPPQQQMGAQSPQQMPPPQLPPPSPSGQRTGSFTTSAPVGIPAPNALAPSQSPALSTSPAVPRAQPPPPTGPRPSSAVPGVVRTTSQSNVTGAPPMMPLPPRASMYVGSPAHNAALLGTNAPSRVPMPPPNAAPANLPPPPTTAAPPPQLQDTASPRATLMLNTPLGAQRSASSNMLAPRKDTPPSQPPPNADAARDSASSDDSSRTSLSPRDALSPRVSRTPNAPPPPSSPPPPPAPTGLPPPLPPTVASSGVAASAVSNSSAALSSTGAGSNSRRGASANLSDLSAEPAAVTRTESKPLKFFGVSSEQTGTPSSPPPSSAGSGGAASSAASEVKKEEKEKEKKKWTALFGAAPKQAESEAPQSKLLYSERETELLQQIVGLIITKMPGVIVAMYEHVDKERHEQLAAAFVTTSFGAPSATLALLEYLVEEEFTANLSAGKEILRENGLTIRFLRAYMRCVAGDYLQTLLGDFVQAVMADKKLSLELDPGKASPEELPGNLRELQARVSSLIAHMSSKRALDAMPPGLRMACHYVHEQARKHRPSHTRIYVGSFLLLRFVNPALFSPETHGLVPGNKPLSAQARRNLILVSKVLQNVSNDVTQSKKEPFMNDLDTGGRWQQMLYDWFDEIVQVKYNPQSVHERVTAAPSADHLHLLHALVFQYRAQLAQALGDGGARKELDSLLERLGSYQHKESFSFLEDEHNRLVKQLLQARQDEARYLGYIQVQKKAKKNVELVKGILIITRCRILLLAENGKIGADVHQLQLTRIRSSIADHLELIFDDKAILGVSKEVDQIIAIIHRQFVYTFPGMPPELRFQLDVQPPSRLAHLTKAALHVEACDSLVPAYRSVCDLYQVPPVAELCWDLEHLYASTAATTLDLAKFTDAYRSPVTDLHALPLLHALGYNRQITALELSEFKFQETTFKGLVELAKTNCTLRRIALRHVSVGGGKGGSAGKGAIGLFFNAMQANLALPVTALDLTGTALDDKAAFALAGLVANLPRSLVELSLRGAVGKNDVKTVLQGFHKNAAATFDLRTLDLSETKFGPELTPDLADVLAQCPELRTLALQETGVAIGTLVAKGLRNNTRRLERLDLSHNKFGKDTAWNGLAELLQSEAHGVHELDISDTQVPVSVLQQLLTITEGHVAIFAAQNALGPAGAKAVGEVATKITAVDKLDLADNGFGDQGLAALVEGLCNNQSLTWLRLDHNYKESGDKHRRALVHQLEMLASSICPLEVLKFQGSGGRRVGAALEPFFHALVANTTLTELDVSGHGFGDQGAMALARALQLNQVLQRVAYDDNQTGLIGFLNLADAISRSKTLKSAPIPFLDVATLLGAAKDAAERERISKVLARLELSERASAQ